MTALLRPAPKTLRRPAAKAKTRPRAAVLMQPGKLIELFSIPWSTYEALDATAPDSGTRFSFHLGRIDIMTLSNDHERIKGCLGHLIASHCYEEDIEFVTTGSATLRLTGSHAREPDDSFTFGTIAKAVPDLVIEISLTSGGIDKLDFYAAFKVPEVWIWESGQLGLFALEGKGYKRVRKSRLLPRFDASLAGELAAWPSTSQAVKEYRKRKAKKAK